MTLTIRIPAGKFKGELVVDLPSGYLKWVAENWEDDEIASIADDEYNRRSDEDDHFWE